MELNQNASLRNELQDARRRIREHDQEKESIHEKFIQAQRQRDDFETQLRKVEAVMFETHT